MILIVHIGTWCIVICHVNRFCSDSCCVFPSSYLWEASVTLLYSRFIYGTVSWFSLIFFRFYFVPATNVVMLYRVCMCQVQSCKNLNSIWTQSCAQICCIVTNSLCIIKINELILFYVIYLHVFDIAIVHKEVSNTQNGNHKGFKILCLTWRIIEHAIFLLWKRYVYMIVYIW